MIRRCWTARLIQLPVDEQLLNGFANVSLLECEIASEARKIVSDY
jgi:hypothetical protein